MPSEWRLVAATLKRRSSRPSRSSLSLVSAARRTPAPQFRALQPFFHQRFHADWPRLPAPQAGRASSQSWAVQPVAASIPAGGDEP